jgi:mitochondrial fission protein ELM1
LVIAAGRQAILVAIALRHKAKTVVLMNPGVPSYYFDVVIAPVHDKIVGKSVIATQGALHGIDSSKLVFPEYLLNYPSPKVGVLLGGNSIHGTYESSLAVKLADDLKKFCANGGSLIITPSRRTPLAWLENFEKNLNGVVYWIWDQKTENPYPGLLSGVDVIVVCEDSISMASEACVIGKPVFIYTTGVKKAKFKYFYQQLFDKGYAQPFSFDVTLEKNKDPKVLKEVDRVVKQISKMIDLT